jgi:very-short-patch-repair endonuclease
MAQLEKLLEESRRELLDLSTRNRLLSIPVESRSARVIHVGDEKSDVVFRLLVEERKAMGFLPGVERRSKPSSTAAVPVIDDLDEAENGLPQPDGEIDEATQGARRHVDTKLQTALTSDGLQTRLLALYRDAQLIMEEQGVNILYLAMGRLKWFEAEKVDIPRHAPLILVPVQLQRRSALDRFTLKWREEDVQENLSLAAKLNSEFGIELPKFPLEEDLVPSLYCEAVAIAVAGQRGWQVQVDAMTLGFFSFAKFLMYRDLDPRAWPDPAQLLSQPALGGLLRDGFPAVDRPLTEDLDLDELIPAARLDHVVDADGSQTLAIEMVRQGRSLVMQGPPGTGKSQSITNVIATAVLDGKKVLFVAEKLAALEVVKRRLEAAGLGALCLELHSHKAHKRAVLEEIGRTWNLGRPRGQELEAVVGRLEQTRSRLNAHAAMLHTRLEPSGITPFRILGALALLGDRGWALGEVDLSEARAWTPEDLRERRALVGELEERVRQMGSPLSHPWRGVERETVLNIDLPRIRETLERLAATLPALRSEAHKLASLLRQPEPSDFSRAEAIRRMAAHVAAAPTLDRDALCNGVWLAGLDGLRYLLDHGRSFAEIRTKLATAITDEAFETDLTSARAAIAAHGRSWFRFLNGEFRKSLAALRGVLRGKPPSAHLKRIALLDDLIDARRLLLVLRERAEIGRRAFGVAWRSENSDWEQLNAVISWVDGEAEACLGPDFHETFGELDPREDFAQLSGSLGERLSEARLAAKVVKDEVALNLVTAFNQSDFDSVSLAALEDRLAQWRARLEDLTRWNIWFLRAVRARPLGLGVIVEAMEADKLPDASAADVFDRAYYSRLLREAVRMQPELAQFDGLEHQWIVQNFRAIDLDRLTLAKYRVLTKHYTSLPLRHAGVGATGILLAELERKRGHRPVRKLLKDAGSVVQAIKPVFMMSPLSVAQFLEPGALDFDLLVIDEASQVQPVDALGAFARAKQHVVVGDSKQLPPTRFFSRLTSNEDSESEISEEDMPAAQAKDVESILGLCCARGLPQTMLRWHYRSRHHSLIAVSNREFYENKLFIVPSPHLVVADLGLAFHFVEGGIYDRGQSRTNRVEARVVCRAILDHARKQPGQSLGVAAFSMHQKQAIEDELELLRREQPDLESFFHAHPHEPFFVKNLENVQGDEREVIFISVGYGPDTSGYIAMNFGPLSSEGGERRLNVLISRAKRSCVVFASLRADDIDLARVTGRGVRCLKAFLQFAETGRLAVAERTAREEDSPFEEAVRRAIESLGYEVHPQVGVAGFFVDLGVLDPAKRSRYLLGIECDGAAYHSSRSARDRDRLRQAVLEDHGWIIHRIWSTDWFQRPGEQLRKVAAALEKSKITLAISQPQSIPPTNSDGSNIERDANHDDIIDLTKAQPVPYVEARFNVPLATQPHELTAQQMAEVLFRIVQVEGPVHEDELTARVRDLWGLGRAGSRIQGIVARGIRALLVSGRCQREDACLFLPEAPVPVRSREVVRSASLRKVDLLPPQELCVAIESVVGNHYGASLPEIAVAVSRLIGFKAVSAGLRETIERQVQSLKVKGRLREQDGLIRKVSDVIVESD